MFPSSLVAAGSFVPAPVSHVPPTSPRPGVAAPSPTTIRPDPRGLMSYYGAKVLPPVPPGMLGALMGGTAPSVTPGAAPPGAATGAAPGAVTAGAALFGAALGAAPGTAPPGAAPGAAPGSLNITGDQMLYLMNMMSGGKAPPSRRTHSGNPRGGSRAGSSTQTGSGGGGATRRHRRSTSDTFSPAWTCMGDISPDDKVTSLKCLQPLVGDLRLRQEWNWIAHCGDRRAKARSIRCFRDQNLSTMKNSGSNTSGLAALSITIWSTS